MIYSVWGTEDGSEFTFVEGLDLPWTLAVNSPPQVRLKVFEADSYSDAMKLYYEWQGWEPYWKIDE